MPIYEFYCQGCGHEFEQIVSFSAATVPACPACASADVGRHMSRPAIHFKGSGWYITDSRKGNGKHANSAAVSTGDKSESGAGNEGSSESATETKAATPVAEKDSGTAAKSTTEKSATAKSTGD
ncbi:MAG: zinc ribbon domain-containing protein [Litorilinea sp.]